MLRLARWRASKLRCCELSAVLQPLLSTPSRGGGWGGNPASQPLPAAVERGLRPRRSRCARLPLPSIALGLLVPSASTRCMRSLAIDWFALHEHTAAFNAAVGELGHSGHGQRQHIARAARSAAGPLPARLTAALTGRHHCSAQRQVLNWQSQLLKLRPQGGGIPSHHYCLLRGVQPPLCRGLDVCGRDAFYSCLVPGEQERAAAHEGASMVRAALWRRRARAAPHPAAERHASAGPPGRGAVHPSPQTFSSLQQAKQAAHTLRQGVPSHSIRQQPNPLQT